MIIKIGQAPGTGDKDWIFKRDKYGWAYGYITKEADLSSDDPKDHEDSYKLVSFYPTLLMTVERFVEAQARNTLSESTIMTQSTKDLDEFLKFAKRFSGFIIKINKSLSFLGIDVNYDPSKAEEQIIEVIDNSEEEEEE